MAQSGRWATVVSSAVVALVVSGGVAVASHQFPDIPTNSFFHKAITAIGDAGCAGGYQDGTFKQNNNATRGQFAYWLNNCAGRVSFVETGEVALATSEGGPLATLAMKAGALSGGAGFVTVDVVIETETSSTSELPCEAAFRIAQAGGTGGGLESVDVDIVDTGVTEENAIATMSDLVAVNGGNTVTVYVYGSLDPACTATVRAETAVRASYVPFDGTGAGGGAGELNEAVEPS